MQIPFTLDDDHANRLLNLLEGLRQVSVETANALEPDEPGADDMRRHFLQTADDADELGRALRMQFRRHLSRFN